jgi:acyl-CoA synthetase (AMP-forming)/AMP-acid ligase II
VALEEQELCAFLQTRLAKFKVPRHLHFTNEALPKTGTGKILKRQLRETLWAGKDRRIQG